jgi:hypothetical protein
LESACKSGRSFCFKCSCAATLFYVRNWGTLNPATFDLINQLHFLEDHCARNTSVDFADAVEALYKRLRKEGKT